MFIKVQSIPRQRDANVLCGKQQIASYLPLSYCTRWSHQGQSLNLETLQLQPLMKNERKDRSSGINSSKSTISCQMKNIIWHQAEYLKIINDTSINLSRENKVLQTLNNLINDNNLPILAPRINNVFLEPSSRPSLWEKYSPCLFSKQTLKDGHFGKSYYLPKM